MITAVDTNILIDLINQHSEAIETLALASSQGQLIICEIVYAEMCAGLPVKELENLSEDFGIKFVNSSTKALGLAGEAWRRYRTHHKGPRERVMADFIVGAHAFEHANRLLTSDRGFYRNYFKNLTIMSYPT